MKWSSIFVLATLAFLVNACERHPASELPPEHASAFGEHGWAPGQPAKHGEHGDSHAPASESHGAAPAHAAATPAPAAAAPAGAPVPEAPKMFPEKK